MILCLFFTLSLHAFELPDMSKYTQLEGDYDQTRVIKEVNVSLKSSGKFKIGPQIGITWAQAKPFPNTVTIKDSEIVTSDGGESRSAAADPISLEISKTILQVFKNDLTGLSKNFSVKKEGTKASWKLVLQPKSRQLKKMIGSISVIGKGFVDSVSINESSGGSIQIRFSNLKASQ